MPERPPVASPLTSDDCRALGDCERKGRELIELLTACRECGLPMEDLEPIVATQFDRAVKLRARFFPDAV